MVAVDVIHFPGLDSRMGVVAIAVCERISNDRRMQAVALVYSPPLRSLMRLGVFQLRVAHTYVERVKRVGEVDHIDRVGR